jgi:hypothetical protein
MWNLCRKLSYGAVNFDNGLIDINVSLVVLDQKLSTNLERETVRQRKCDTINNLYKSEGTEYFFNIMENKKKISTHTQKYLTMNNLKEWITSYNSVSIIKLL